MLPLALPVPGAVDSPRPAVLVSAQQRADAAQLRVRPPVSLLAPRVDLEVRQRLSDRTTPQSTTETTSAWLLTARWELPLGGEMQSRRREGERRAEAAQAEADRVAVQLQSELLSLAPRIAQGERAIEQLASQVERYRMLLRAGELQFEAGRRTLAQLVQLHDSRASTPSSGWPNRPAGCSSVAAAPAGTDRRTAAGAGSALAVTERPAGIDRPRPHSAAFTAFGRGGTRPRHRRVGSPLGSQAALRRRVMRAASSATPTSASDAGSGTAAAPIRTPAPPAPTALTKSCVAQPWSITV